MLAVFFPSENLASPSPLQFLFSRQWTIIYYPEGISSLSSTCIIMWILGTWSYTLKLLFLCIFFLSCITWLWYHNWASLLGFYSSADFSSIIPPSSSLSAFLLFAWIAKKDKRFQLIKMYFDSWSPLSKWFQDSVFLFLLSYGNLVGNAIRQVCYYFFLHESVSSFNLMLSLIKKYQHWGEKKKYQSFRWQGNGANLIFELVILKCEKRKTKVSLSKN